MLNQLKKIAKKPLARGVAVAALAAAVSGCGTTDMYGYRAAPGPYSAAPAPQPRYTGPAINNPSPHTGRLVHRYDYANYCVNDNGRATWAGGYPEMRVGADNQTYLIVNTVELFPNQLNWSCSTLGRVNLILPKVAAGIPYRGVYNNLPVSGPMPQGW